MQDMNKLDLLSSGHVNSTKPIFNDSTPVFHSSLYTDIESKLEVRKRKVVDPIMA